jgi:hypothetical protein
MHQRQLVAQPQAQTIVPLSLAQESLCTDYCSACHFPLSPSDPACGNCGLLTRAATATPRQTPHSRLFWITALTLPTLLFLTALHRLEQQPVHAATATQSVTMVAGVRR